MKRAILHVVVVHGISIPVCILSLGFNPARGVLLLAAVAVSIPLILPSRSPPELSIDGDGTIESWAIHCRMRDKRIVSVLADDLKRYPSLRLSGRHTVLKDGSAI